MSLIGIQKYSYIQFKNCSSYFVIDQKSKHSIIIKVKNREETKILNEYVRLQNLCKNIRIKYNYNEVNSEYT